MGVFNNQSKTKRAVADPGTDHKLPGSRSLSLSNMTGQTALAGTKGQHCNLIHGDHWHEVKGEEFQTVSSHQTIKVLGNHKETISGTCYQNMIGPQTVTNMSVRNETRLDAFTLIYGDNECCQDSDGDKNWKPTDFQGIYVASLELQNLKHEFATAHVEIKAAHAAATGANFEFKLADSGVTIIGDDVKELENKLTACDNRVTAVKNTVSPLIQVVGGLNSNLLTAMYLEVLLGVNQAI